MSILSDGTLYEKLYDLIKDPDSSLVNPASIDIRVGKNALIEDIYGEMQPHNFEKGEFLVPSNAFLLVETYEHIMVPENLCVELKLKSTIARMGWNHSLAFWVDPGWNGILTMELHNLRKIPLKLEYGMRFAQIIVHELDHAALHPYSGRYQNAGGVQNATDA